MCNFHSIIVSATGVIKHHPDNSHSQMASAAGWRNTPKRQMYWECEYDPRTDEMPTQFCQSRNDAPAPEAAERAAQKHYEKLKEALQTGKIAPLFLRPGWVDVLEAVAGSLNTPKSVLSKLSRHKNNFVREAVADNTNTSKSALFDLANDPNAFVCRAVARNINTPKSALSQLSSHKINLVCEAVASSPNTTKTVLSRLSGHHNCYVREAVAGNPNTPKLALLKLSKDRDTDVRELARNTYKKTNQWYEY